MARVRVHAFSMSLDGFAAGPRQGLEDPLGVGGEQLHAWLFDAAGRPDPAVVAAGTEGIGATVMGRNMFGPVRGPWPDESWRGWWGEQPPFDHPVFVVTHYARASLEVGGTVFHFVTDGPDAALDRALEAAGGQDVRIGGGASTVRHYLRSGAVDELHLVVVPVLLGDGERLFDGPLDGYEVAGLESAHGAAHVRLLRSS